MPGSNLAEQERDAIELFGRADRLVPDTSLRRAYYPAHAPRTRMPADSLCAEKTCLSHAIKLAHSSPYVAQTHGRFNIAKFFKAFPDLEEDAINAVYDLCEDQDPNVRSCSSQCGLSTVHQLTFSYI
jgi:hypothetical protein